MFSLSDLFNPRCRGEIATYLRGIVGGHISQRNGYIDLEFTVQLQLRDAKIDFPRYIADYLDNYELHMNGNSDFYLTLNFQSGKNNHYIRCLKQSLTEEIKTGLPQITVHIGNQGSPTWVSGLEGLNHALDHLKKPAIQNNVITRANRFHLEKTRLAQHI